MITFMCMVIPWAAPKLAYVSEGGTSGKNKLIAEQVLHANFHPIGATCRPCGAKNLKIALSE